MGTTWLPVTPGWVTPRESEVADLHWLAYGLVTDTRRASAAGIAITMAWIRGGRTGPITDRDEQPVTRNVADAERWAAEAARDPGNSPPLAAIYASLDVAPWPLTVAFDPEYALGVWHALRWVLGVPGQDAPLVVPRRHPDGRVHTADDVYQVLTRGDDSWRIPEQQRELRDRAEAAAATYATAAEQVETVKRRFTA